MKALLKFLVAVTVIVAVFFVVVPMLAMIGYIIVGQSAQTQFVGYSSYHAPGITNLVMAVGVPLLVVGFFLCIGATAWRFLGSGERVRDRAQLSLEEGRLMQEIHQGLGRLETRVESLETILFDRAGDRTRHAGHGLGN